MYARIQPSCDICIQCNIHWRCYCMLEGRNTNNIYVSFMIVLFTLNSGIQYGAALALEICYSIKIVSSDSGRGSRHGLQLHEATQSPRLNLKSKLFLLGIINMSVIIVSHLYL